MARSLNSVQLIGNLTRDPELRYTPQGTAVCTIGLATNRSWTTDTGEKKEDAEYHRLVAWNKLAELCAQLLSKGTKAYFHGRLSTRSWQDQKGEQKSTTEIIIDDMIILSGKKSGDEEVAGTAPKAHSTGSGQASSATSGQKESQASDASEDVSPDDIPF